MALETKQVFSSHVATIGYDDEKQQLIVTWDTGKTSVYSGVPLQVAQNVMNSWSIGSALHDQIKGKYDHSYMGEQ